MAKLSRSNLFLGTGVSFAHSQDVAHDVIDAALKAGIRRFDTAPSYHTEGILGVELRRCGEAHELERGDLWVQTKIDGWQMQDGSGLNVARHVKSGMQALGVDYLDCLLVHWPFPEYLQTTWQNMVRLREEGLARRVGVCNVRMRQLKQMEAWDCMPDVIQIERHPLRICSEEVMWCHQRDVALQAYSPLCKMNERIRQSEVLASIARRYGVDIGQVVLRWHLDSGVAPILLRQSRAGCYSILNLIVFLSTRKRFR